MIYDRTKQNKISVTIPKVMWFYQPQLYVYTSMPTHIKLEILMQYLQIWHLILSKYSDVEPTLWSLVNFCS